MFCKRKYVQLIKEQSICRIFWVTPGWSDRFDQTRVVWDYTHSIYTALYRWWNVCSRYVRLRASVRRLSFAADVTLLNH